MGNNRLTFLPDRKLVPSIQGMSHRVRLRSTTPIISRSFSKITYIYLYLLPVLYLKQSTSYYVYVDKYNIIL